MTTSLRNIDIMKDNTKQHSLHSGSGTLSCCSATDTTVHSILKFSRTRNPLWKKDSQSHLNSPSVVFTRFKAFYVSCTNTQTTQVNCNYALKVWNWIGASEVLSEVLFPKSEPFKLKEVAQQLVQLLSMSFTSYTWTAVARFSTISHPSTKGCFKKSF